MYIAKDKIQMGIVAVTNGYNINAVTAKDAGDDWTEIPLLITIKPEDVIAIKQLYSIAPETVIVRDTLGNPVHTASSLLNLQELPDGSLKYPMVIQRSHPVGRLTFVLDWDGYLNDDYTTNNWNLNWNVTILEPDPLLSPVYYNGVGDAVDIAYIDPINYIETVDIINEREVTVNITNNPEAGWYWRYIHIDAAIASEFVAAITKQAANGLTDAVISVEHNEVRTTYMAGDVIMLNDDGEGNLLIPLHLDRNKPTGVISILADFDGADANRFYLTPFKINYNINPINPPQTVSTISFGGFDNVYEYVKDGEYLNPLYAGLVEVQPPANVDKSYKITNTAEAGWYWNKVRLFARIAAVDVVAMNNAYTNGYRGIVLTIKHNGQTIRTSNASQLASMYKDVAGNIYVPLEVNRATTTGSFEFMMDWDSTHLDYVQGKFVLNYEIIPTNPVPLKSWITYRGLNTTGLNVPVVEEPTSEFDWYKNLRIDNLTSANATNTISLSGNIYTTTITNTLEAGWYWNKVPVYFTIAQDAIDLVTLAKSKNHIGEVLKIVTPWQTYTYTTDQVLAMSNHVGGKWFTITIPRSNLTGKLAITVDWDMGLYPEATTTNMEVNYTLRAIDPTQILSMVKWGGVDSTYANIVDAPYLTPENYIENVIVEANGYKVDIENREEAGWYWNVVHVNLILDKANVNSLRNAVSQGFTFTDLAVNLNGVITRYTLDQILALNKNINGDYLIPLSLLRSYVDGSIRVTVDWDGTHKDFLENTTVINYIINANDPNALKSTLTYRGIKSLNDEVTLTPNEPGVIPTGYLTETFSGVEGGYVTKIVTSAEAGWYWTNVKVYFAIAPEVLTFIADAINKGHTGTVLTIANGQIEHRFTSEEILDLELDLDGSALLPYQIPRTVNQGLVVANVDWDTNLFPEATASVVRLSYEIDINNPAQVASEMMYYGIDDTREYETNGEYLLPIFAEETITANKNTYRTKIDIANTSGWYWNKIAIAAYITATDVNVIQAAMNAGFSGTVLSAYQNGTLVHSMSAADILTLPRDEAGNALVPFYLSDQLAEGFIVATIDWDVNHLDYTQSTWRLDYNLKAERPNLFVPRIYIREDLNTVYGNKFPLGTYVTSNGDIGLKSVYPLTAEHVGLYAYFDQDTVNYITSLAYLDPNLVVLQNGIYNNSYTAQQLANIISGTGELGFYFPAKKSKGTETFRLTLDLDGSVNNIWQPMEFDVKYEYHQLEPKLGKLDITYVESEPLPNFVNGYQSYKENVEGVEVDTVTIILNDQLTNDNTYDFEFRIPKDNWDIFKEARRLGMPDNTVVLEILLLATNNKLTCTAQQLENMVYFDDGGNAYFMQKFRMNQGSFTVDYDWSKGYTGLVAGSHFIKQELLTLTKQSLSLINNNWDSDYSDYIMPIKDYTATITEINQIGVTGHKAVISLDSNYPINRDKIRLAIVFPTDVTARIETLINTSPNVTIFTDLNSGQSYTAQQFSDFERREGLFIYPVVASREQQTRSLAYQMNLNGVDENYYTTFVYTVEYQVNNGPTVNPTIIPRIVADGASYIGTSVSGTTNGFKLTLEAINPLVPMFSVDLAIPAAYDTIIKESVRDNPNEVILSGGGVVIYGRDYETLETDAQGNKVVKGYTILPNPDNTDPNDPSIVVGLSLVNLSYTPNYSGTRAKVVELSLEITVIAIEIECTDASASTYVDMEGNVQETLYDVQLGGEYHKGITYAQMVTICNDVGLAVIPVGDATFPVCEEAPLETEVFDISGKWKARVNGALVDNNELDLETLKVKLLEHNVELVIVEDDIG